MTDKELYRGAALQKISQLRERQKILNQGIASLKRQLEDLSRKYQPLIGQFQEKADRLASKFRKLYEESQGAFKNGDGESAKSLSIEGRAVQGECESLNNQANKMRYELKSLQRSLELSAGEFNANEARLSDLKNALKTIHRPKLLGVEHSPVSVMSLELSLDKLPQLALREIEKIELVSEHPLGIEGGEKLGDTNWSSGTRKAAIRVYSHRPELGEIEFETITHEVGHEIFLKLIAYEEKMAWEELYKSSGDWFVSKRAIRSAEEDFCECFRILFSNDSVVFAKRDNQKYNFIKSLVKRLEKTS